MLNKNLSFLFLLLDSVRGVKVFEESSIRTIQFEAKTVEENVNMTIQSHSLVQLITKSLKDCAGLYLILKSCAEGRRYVIFIVLSDPCFFATIIDKKIPQPMFKVNQSLENSKWGEGKLSIKNDSEVPIFNFRNLFFA